MRCFLPVLFLLAAGFASSGCASCGGTGDSAHVYYPGTGACETVAEAAAREEYAQLPFYAALAASAYNTSQESGLPLKAPVESLEAFCADESSFYLPPGVELLNPDRYPQLGKPAHGRDIGRLNYSIFARRGTDGANTVYLAFRGTDDGGDWFANLRWFTRAIPFASDEYDQLQRILPELEALLHQEYGENATIVTLGHSLGGGLAQFAAYGMPWKPQASGVGTVYAFDPSPETGFYSLKQWLRERNAVGLRIHRVYDHGEVLAYVRLAMKGLYPVSEENPAIREARFNLLRGDVMSQHGMWRFACSIWKAFGAKEPRPPVR